MKVFISWSGAHSRVIAEALNDWLPRMIQAVKPFFSAEIEKGAQWDNEIDAALEGTRFGVVCLTRDNLKSTWIHYEAGALSKTKGALVWTFLHNVNPSDVPPPLGKFQHTVAEKQDVLRMLKSMNERLRDSGGEPLHERLLENNLDVFWPLLEAKLNEASSLAPQEVDKDTALIPTPQRGDREILDEILDLVRALSKEISRSNEDNRSSAQGNNLLTAAAPSIFMNLLNRGLLDKRISEQLVGGTSFQNILFESPELLKPLSQELIGRRPSDYVVKDGFWYAEGQVTLKSPEYELNGEGFSMQGHGGEYGTLYAQDQSPFRLGDSISVTGSFRRLDHFGACSIKVANTRYRFSPKTDDSVWLDGKLEFKDGAFEVPIGTNESSITLTAPFQFSGALAGIRRDSTTPFFEARLIGSGKAKLKLVLGNYGEEGPLYDFESIRYEFQS